MKLDKTEEALARCLARVYRSINWRQVGVKSAYTYFTDRVRAASRMSSVPSFLEELGRMCGVSFVKQDIEDLDTLRGDEERVLDMLRHETNYAVLIAIEEVERMKKEQEEEILEEVEGGEF